MFRTSSKNNTNQESGHDFQQQEYKKKETWPRKGVFALVCLGQAVGLGNIWKFPYLCYSNGGSAFLIPYSIMLFFLGLPVLFLEFAIAQYSAMGPVTLFKNLLPSIRGIGWTCFLLTFCLGIYYNNIISWTLYYSYTSLSSELPWKGCDHEYSSPNCFERHAYDECVAKNHTIYNNGRCMKDSEAYKLGFTDHTRIELRKSPSDEYFNSYLFGESEGIFSLGDFQPHLVTSLLVTWIIVFFCLLKGIRSYVKVAYFTNAYAYIVLTILIIRGCTLPGAFQGLTLYMTPDLEKIKLFKVWEQAAKQVFFTLSIATGQMLTLASYNRFHSNIMRDALLVGLGDTMTSLLAGVAIYSTLGFLAHATHQPVVEVAKASGLSLAFVIYPEAVTQMSLSPLWSFLFFSLLFTLALDSQAGIMETIITCLTDEFPVLRAKRMWVVLIVVVLAFLFGLPITRKGGLYAFAWIDFYSSGWPSLLVGFLEVFLVSWVYGIGNLMQDLKEMLHINMKPSVRLMFMTVYMTITPSMLAVILSMAWVHYKPLKSGDYEYPFQANVTGFALSLLPILVFILSFIYQFFLHIFEGKTPREAILLGVKPKSKYRRNARKPSTILETSVVKRIYPKYIAYKEEVATFE